jgi:hypothetical protein
MILVHRQGAGNGFRQGEDVRKLFSPYDYVPEVYALADETPVDIDYINHTGEVTVPLGIKTGQTGDTRFTFTGMDNYNQASKITFTDVLLEQEIDLSGKASFTYEFDNQVEGIQNARFFLNFQASPTALKDLKELKDLKIYSDDQGIHIISPDNIRKITLYNLQEQKIYENSIAGSRSYSIRENFDSPRIIVRKPHCL